MNLELKRDILCFTRDIQHNTKIFPANVQIALWVQPHGGESLKAVGFDMNLANSCLCGKYFRKYSFSHQCTSLSISITLCHVFCISHHLYHIVYPMSPGCVLFRTTQNDGLVGWMNVISRYFPRIAWSFACSIWFSCFNSEVLVVITDNLQSIWLLQDLKNAMFSMNKQKYSLFYMCSYMNFKIKVCDNHHNQDTEQVLTP